MLSTSLWRISRFVTIAIMLFSACSPQAPAPPPTPSTLPEDAATALTVWPEESTIGFTALALGGNLTVEGSYAAASGSVTLVPEDNALRVHAFLVIDTDSVTVGNAVIDEALRLGMETGLYPVATFDAFSNTLVPITEDPVAFVLEGTLTLHGVTNPVIMQVGPATLRQNHLVASATMDIDLADYGIDLPSAMVNSEIALNVILIADENAPPPGGTDSP